MPSDEPTPVACPYPTYEGGNPQRGDLPATGDDASGLEAAVWDALRQVQDPEMPVSIVDLGLVYGVTVDGGRTRVALTLTYTGCPARRMLLDEVEAAAASPPGVDGASVELVWNPPWTVDLVTDRGRERLREFGLSI